MPSPLDVTSLGAHNGVASVALRTVLMTSIYLAFTELQYRVYEFLHRRKLLTRVQRGATPDARDLVTVTLSAMSVVLPNAIYQTVHSQRLWAKMSFELDALAFVVLTSVLLIVQDTWYFFGHRFMHQNKFFWFVSAVCLRVLY